MLHALKTRRAEAARLRRHRLMVGTARSLVTEAVSCGRRTADGAPDVTPDDVIVSVFAHHAVRLTESEAAEYLAAGMAAYGYRLGGQKIRPAADDLA